MDTVTLYLIIAATSLVCVSMLSVMSLKGFTAWIDLKRAELAVHSPSPDGVAPTASSRIEIADLKERLRKLEAIAAGVDL